MGFGMQGAMKTTVHQPDNRLRRGYRDVIVIGLPTKEDRMDTTTIDGVTFYADEVRGAWYEDPSGRVGTLYAPMNDDGSPDIDAVAIIEVAYEDA